MKPKEPEVLGSSGFSPNTQAPPPHRPFTAVSMTPHRLLTSAISGEVEQQDVAAEVGQVVQGSQMLLQLPVGQLTPQDRRQMTEDVGVQRGGPAEEKEGGRRVTSGTDTGGG